MAQHEIVRPIELIDDKGCLTEEGWARKPLWHYARTKIVAPLWRIKEWDYYYVISHDGKYGITFTMSDLGYLGLFSVAWLDFASGTCVQSDEMTFMPLGKTGFTGESDAGRISHESAKIKMSFTAGGGKRRLYASCPGFEAPDGSKGLVADLELTQDLGADSMNIATSWKENRRAFYYNRKINCMAARGIATLGTHTYSFSPETSSGGLDWGRGVWTYKNRWYWGSASGSLGGLPFGWNIGYGFSDRGPASENMVFYDGRAHKLDEVVFHIDTSDYLAPWKFTS
ncbi:MAG TPA: DUF2804 domain-containing protein, partial [Rectinemataceae bacterium]|nr:DUF2804 domain-containing protein [Rectinemataceae bacterium]